MPNKINVDNRSMFTGDNLDILRGLNSNSFDLIYADPPRNSGEELKTGNTSRAKGFEFTDKWTADDAHPEWEDEIAVRQPDAMHIINAFRLIQDEGVVNYLVFLAVRLLELQRVMKPSGSIYLHCRQDSAHGIQAIMDAIFGREQFRNDIAFRRYGRDITKGGEQRWKWAHDKLLFYAGPRTYTWHKVLQPHPVEYFRLYVYEDERGKYQSLPLMHDGVASDDRGAEWRGYNAGGVGHRWSVPMPVLRQLYPRRSDLDSLTTPEKLDLLDAGGMVQWSKVGGPPRYKIYDDTKKGDRQSDFVATIIKVKQNSREHSGWPKQVPEELLEVIINSSTDEGDIVLDPFSGSGTACVVAEKLNRRWVGIEQAPEGYDVLVSRMRRQVKLKEGISHSRIAPTRTDPKEFSAIVPDPRTIHALYERQSGRCNGCEHELPLHALTTDLIDRSLAAPTKIEHLQLLCHYCRVLRGRNSMNYLGRRVYETRVHESIDKSKYQ